MSDSNNEYCSGIKHKPKVYEKPVIIARDKPTLIDNSNGIKFYPSIITAIGTLTEAIVFTQMSYLITHPLIMANGEIYRHTLRGLLTDHFTWIGESQLSRVLHNLGDKKLIKITSHVGGRNIYTLTTSGLSIFNNAKKAKLNYIMIYPALIEALNNINPDKKRNTSVQQSIILVRLQRLVFDEKSKTITRCYKDLFNQFFNFMGLKTLQRAMLSLVLRGILVRTETPKDPYAAQENRIKADTYHIDYDKLQQDYFPFTHALAILKEIGNPDTLIYDANIIAKDQKDIPIFHVEDKPKS